MKLTISITERANAAIHQPTEQAAQSAPNTAPAHQRIQAIFAQLRQLPRDTPVQTAPVHPAAGAVSGSNSREFCLVMPVVNSVNIAVLEQVYRFFESSDQSYEAILKLSNELGQIGLQEYRKHIGACKG